MVDKILQWNVRGFQANREELLLLTRLYQPCVSALQETLQSDCSKMSLSGYCVLHKSSGRDSTSGGVALLINQNVYVVLLIYIQICRLLLPESPSGKQ